MATLARVAASDVHVVNVGVLAPALLAPLDVGPVRVEQEARTILEEQVKKIENMGCAVAQSHVRMGDAAKEVVNLVEEIGVSLVAAGSRGRGGIRRALMGSVSHSVARHTHCPVLVVRDSGERMPKDHERRFSYYDPSGYRRVG